MQQKLITELKLSNNEIIYGENVNGIDLKINDKVIVYFERSYDIAVVSKEERLVESTKIDKNIYKIVRKLNQQDMQRLKENSFKSDEAYKIIKNTIHNYEIEIKIVKVFYSFDRTKLYVYYTSEKQTDLKKLIREFANRFKAKIIIKQIGPRDETKMLGGIGMCGYELCCKKWIKKFESISIEMAKTQQLSLNIPKLSGVCNRLKCCLHYEYLFYKECVEKFPKIGSNIKTKDGEGKVVGIDCIKELIHIEFTTEDKEKIIKTFKAEEVL